MGKRSFILNKILTCRVIVLKVRLCFLSLLSAPTMANFPKNNKASQLIPGK